MSKQYGIIVISTVFLVIQAVICLKEDQINSSIFAGSLDEYLLANPTFTIVSELQRDNQTSLFLYWLGSRVPGKSRTN